MENQLEVQNIVPQELGVVATAGADSFTEVLEILKSNETGHKGLRFKGPFKLNEEQKNSVRLLPKAFSLNKTMQSLRFVKVEVDDILVSEALKAGLRRDTVTSIEFTRCQKVSNQRLMETMCEGLKERSTAFQLRLDECSSEFVKPILEASYLKCFSLMLMSVDCTGIDHSVTSLCYKGSLYYISLFGVRGLKEDVFLQLGRCLIPNLIQLDLCGVEVPTSSLKRLIGSLKKILDSGRSNVFKYLNLGDTELDSRLSFACSQLLGSDLVGNFSLNVKAKASRAVVKSISSTVAKTKNLRGLRTGSTFSSRTKFNNFELQKRKWFFDSPFGVNPTVA